jgi:hypothetical protein
MRSSTKSELQMLREICHFLLPQYQCYFCQLSLIMRSEEKFGHRSHGPILARLSVHHIDENRDNNSFDNLVLAHRRCHKAWSNRRRSNKVEEKLLVVRKAEQDRQAEAEGDQNE